jgi:hypothetical protein
MILFIHRNLGHSNRYFNTIPLRPWIKSLNGVEYLQFGFERWETLPDGGIAVHTKALGQPRLEMLYGDEYKDALMRLTQYDAVREDKFTWYLRPASLVLEGVAYEGLSYSWRFESATEKTHRLVSIGTWEIGGSIVGNTVLSQGQVTPAIYEATRDTSFSSACLKELRLFGQPQGMSFQWNHRWSPHQCFDFIASPAGSLLGYWPDKADVRSFTQKNPGEEVYFVADAMHAQRASSIIETPAKHVLFAPAGTGELPEHEVRNRWKDAHDYCNESVWRRRGSSG